MSMSVKIEKKFSKLGVDKINQASKKFYIEAAAVMPDIIVNQILKGISPVEGVGRYKQYSKSYVEQIEHNRKAEKKNNKNAEKALKKGVAAVDKRKHGTAEIFRGKLKSPVNLRLTGFMLKSIRAIPGANELIILFDSPIAKYHNGEGRVERALLPTNGRRFSSLIMKKLKEILTASLKT